MTATQPLRRLHVGARLEDVLYGRVAALMRGRGWRPRVVPYTTYGSSGVDGAGWVRVLARVKLSPRPTGFVSRDVARWWRAFLTVAVADVPVSVRLGSRRHQVCSVRGGYVDVVLASDLGPGWHDVSLEVTGERRRAGVCASWVHRSGSVVSDIDDTVMITALPRPLLEFWNTFVVHESRRQPVPGMAALYSRLLREDPDSLVVYVLTGAWNVARAISRFLARHGYPEGPLLMTDWGPTAEGWFRLGQAHKRTQLRRLVTSCPSCAGYSSATTGSTTRSCTRNSPPRSPRRSAWW